MRGTALSAHITIIIKSRVGAASQDEDVTPDSNRVEELYFECWNAGAINTSGNDSKVIRPRVVAAQKDKCSRRATGRTDGTAVKNDNVIRTPCQLRPQTLRQAKCDSRPDGDGWKSIRVVEIENRTDNNSDVSNIIIAITSWWRFIEVTCYIAMIIIILYIYYCRVIDMP